jgi:VWFA-related protein
LAIGIGRTLASKFQLPSRPKNNRRQISTAAIWPQLCKVRIWSQLLPWTQLILHLSTRHTVVNNLVKYLAENLDPGQAISLVAITGSGLKVLHGLTSDPSALIQALKKVNGELPALQAWTSMSKPRLRCPILLLPQPISFLAQAVHKRSQGRICFKGFHPAPRCGYRWHAAPSHFRACPGERVLFGRQGDFLFVSIHLLPFLAVIFSVLYERAMQSLNDAEIAVYPVDVRGLMNYSPTRDVTYSPRNVSGPAFARSLAARSWLQNSKIDTLRDFAEMTSGRAFYNTKDLVFKRATDDSSSYYLLGYYLDTKNDKPGWRQLKVKVHTPHADVRARNGFLVTKATINPETSKKIEIENALASPLDSTGMALTVRWRGTSADGDKKKIAFGVSLPPDNRTIEQGEKAHFSGEFVALARKSGVTVDSFSQTIQGTPSAETLAKIKAGGLAYNTYLDLPVGQYTVCCLMRDKLSGRIGGVSAR